MITGTLPSGERLLMCPNGLDAYGNYVSTRAFRTPGGMDWVALAKYAPEAESHDAVALGGVFQTFWNELNPAPGVYRWDIIDSFVSYAHEHLLMETADGYAPKGVIVKVSNSISHLPAEQPPVVGIDGGFVFDDYTPGWVKEKMIGALPFVVTRKDGTLVTKDNGSYWIRTNCIYGAGQDYSLWVIPKYDNGQWQAAAHTFIEAISNHYAGSGVTFLLGMGGMDGEWGVYLQNAYAGCDDLRTVARTQYPGLSTVRDLPQWWNPATRAYLGYSSDVDVSLFTGLDLGLHQARILPDSANYIYGGVGVLEVPMTYSTTKAIAWENATSRADAQYVYQELSLAAMTFPRFFDLMGGLWQGDKANLREFVGMMGRTITDTPEIWWKAYSTCYKIGANCPDVPYSGGAWQGWPRDLEAGLTADRLLTYVPYWGDSLTEAQKTGTWARMLRKGKSLTLTTDTRWVGNGQEWTVEVRYLDVGTADIVLTNGGNTGIIKRENTGTYKTVRVSMGQGTGKIALTSTEDMILHGVSIWR
jgi:hypothetical protein